MATLALALVIPGSELSLAAGVMQAIQYFFIQLDIPQAVAPMSVLITIGENVILIGPDTGGILARLGPQLRKILSMDLGRPSWNGVKLGSEYLLSCRGINSW